MSTASDGAGLDPEVAAAIESKFEELYDRQKEYIDSEIETFIDKRGVEALVEVADYLERVENIQDDIDDLGQLLANVHSIRERVGHFEAELERIRAELGDQLDRIEMKLDEGVNTRRARPTDGAAPTLVGVKVPEESADQHVGSGVSAPAISSTPASVKRRIEEGTEESSVRDAQIDRSEYGSPEWAQFSARGEMAVAVSKPHLRYVDENGKVLYIQHSYDDTPTMGERVKIEGENYVIRKESHKFDGDRKESIELTVEAVDPES